MVSEEKVPAQVTIITPVYNEQDSLAAYETAVNQVLFAASNYEMRVIFVDDGSTDGSWRMIQTICRDNPRFSGIRLSRNYGSHVALTAGIDLADGDAVVTLACDLQDPPEVVLEFLEKWCAGARIVWGSRSGREDTGWRVRASNLFHVLLKRFAMPKGSLFATGSFLLIDRTVVECFRKFREHNRITFALVAWTGFEQAVVPYFRRARVSGVSGWNLARMFKALYDAFIGFSTLPIRCITYAGLLLSMLSFVSVGYLVFGWLIGNPSPGWTSIMAALMLLFGILFLMLGVVGEYLSRIYTEVVQRPLYFVSKRTDNM